MLSFKPPLPDRNFAAANNHATQEAVAPYLHPAPTLVQSMPRTASADWVSLQIPTSRSPSGERDAGMLTASFTASPPPPAHRANICRDDAMEALDARFGADVVTSRLAHDVFDDLAALERQLNHESKTEITIADYSRIAPFGGLAGITTGQRTPTRDAQEVRETIADPILGEVRTRHDAAGRLVELQAQGRLGAPEGWRMADRMTVDADGLARLRTTLTGPDGESGMVVRSFDGRTLNLDKAYKSTLPTRLSGVPGFDRAVSTINYLTARACRILGATPDNLQQIKVNRLQHRPTLAHVDWLLRVHPQQSIGEAIGHTTWARTYIRETAEIVGHAVQPCPTIDLEGDPNWVAAHPGAKKRDWHYMTQETERLTIKHLTGQKLPRVDDADGTWRRASQQAVATYKAQRCAGLSAPRAAAQEAEIETLLASRLDAIRNEEQTLRRRYGIPPGVSPRHLNFDVTFQTSRTE